VDKKSQPCFDWIALWRKVGAVERVTHFETQGIARTQTAGANPERFPFCQNFIPDQRRVSCRKENLDAVFTGVARAPDLEWNALVFELFDLISRRQHSVRSAKSLETLGDVRPMDR